MLVTVTNLTDRIINTLDAVDNRVTNGPADLYAPSEGVRVDPLPEPFDSVGELAANGDPGDSVQKAMRIGDFRNQHVLWRPLEPGTRFDLLQKAGIISVAFAAESNRLGTEEDYDLAIA